MTISDNITPADVSPDQWWDENGGCWKVIASPIAPGWCWMPLNPEAFKVLFDEEWVEEKGFAPKGKLIQRPAIYKLPPL